MWIRTVYCTVHAMHECTSTHRAFIAMYSCVISMHMITHMYYYYFVNTYIHVCDCTFRVVQYLMNGSTFRHTLKQNVNTVVSRHTVVCRAAQEAGVPPVSILTGRKKTQFSHLCSSVIPYPIGTKLATDVPAS